MIVIKGVGLLVGLKVTIKKFFKKKITQEYPEVMPSLPERSHGSFSFDTQKCIACGLCADACPNGVINVQWSKDNTGKRKLDDYRMNLGYCLSCGLCIHACPTGALRSDPDFELAFYHRSGTVFSWKGCPNGEDNSCPEG